MVTVSASVWAGTGTGSKQDKRVEARVFLSEVLDCWCLCLDCRACACSGGLLNKTGCQIIPSKVPIWMQWVFLLACSFKRKLECIGKGHILRSLLYAMRWAFTQKNKGVQSTWGLGVLFDFQTQEWRMPIWHRGKILTVNLSLCEAGVPQICPADLLRAAYLCSVLTSTTVFNL